MRNSAFVLLIGVLAIGVGAAQADDHHDDRNREREFRLECKYLGAGVVAGKKGGAVIPHECTAEVRFCRRRHDEDGLHIANAVANSSLAATSDDGDDDFDRCRDDDYRGRDRARLEVECDGRFLFRDRAYREEFAGYEFIFGIPNQLPVIKVPLDQFNFDGDDEGDNASHDRNRDRAHVVNSWLKIADDVLDGFCAVKERRERDHEHHSDHSDTPPPHGPTS